MTGVCTHERKAWVMPRLLVLILVLLAPPVCRAQLSSTFYASSCPTLQSTVQSAMKTQLRSDKRLGASLTRMFFHDCFVQGCDASVLLANTNNFTGEQSANPNVNSLRGFSAIDSIKAAVEQACPGKVSCADILALAAKEGVVAAGGPSWTVQLGRRDSKTASLSQANSNIPNPNSQLATITGQFANKGLSQVDMIALAGAHTFGLSQCSTITPRLYNFQGTGQADPSLDKNYLSTLRKKCPQGGSGSATVNLDQASATTFDSAYYSNLLVNRGIFTSDQTLQSSGGSSASTVGNFAQNQNQFFAQFTASMIKMGNISPLTGSAGEIRKKCSVVNS